MPVTSSSYVLDGHTQADGRRYVTETHTLAIGGPYVTSYLADMNENYQAIMDARVPIINEELIEVEASRILAECPDDFTLNEQTGSEFASKLWATLHRAYQNGNKYTYHRLVWRVWAWVQNGKLTSEQVRLSFNAFFGTNYTSGTSWNGFVTTRLIPIKDRYLALLAETELS